MRDGPGALSDMDSSWDVAAAAVAVIWKMPKYEEMYTFSKMGMSEISRNFNCFFIESVLILLKIIVFYMEIEPG